MPFDMAAVKKVPKPVWIVGGGIVVGYVLLKGKGGGGGAVAGVGSTVGAGSGEGEQPALSSTDLDSFLADQAQNQVDFYQGVLDAINGAAGGAGGAGGTGGTGGTGGGSGGGTTPTVAAKLRAYISKVTPLYNAQGKQTGYVHGGGTTFDVGPLQKIGNYWYYKILSGPNAGSYIHSGGSTFTISKITTPTATTALPTAPAPAPVQSPVGSTSGSLQTLSTKTPYRTPITSPTR